MSNTFDIYFELTAKTMDLSSQQFFNPQTKRQTSSVNHEQHIVHYEYRRQDIQRMSQKLRLLQEKYWHQIYQKGRLKDLNQKIQSKVDCIKRQKQIQNQQMKMLQHDLEQFKKLLRKQQDYNIKMLKDFENRQNVAKNEMRKQKDRTKNIEQKLKKCLQRGSQNQNSNRFEVVGAVPRGEHTFTARDEYQKIVVNTLKDEVFNIRADLNKMQQNMKEILQRLQKILSDDLTIARISPVFALMSNSASDRPMQTIRKCLQRIEQKMDKNVVNQRLGGSDYSANQGQLRRALDNRVMQVQTWSGLVDMQRKVIHDMFLVAGQNSHNPPDYSSDGMRYLNDEENRVSQSQKLSQSISETEKLNNYLKTKMRTIDSGHRMVGKLQNLVGNVLTPRFGSSQKI